MDKQHDQASFSPAVKQKLDDLYRQVRASISYRTVWVKLFSDEERERLGGDVNAAWSRNPDLVRLWAELRGLSQARAVVELGHDLSFLAAGDYRWLLREIGDDNQPHVGSSKPVWDASRRELRYGGKVIRKIRVASVAFNISSILEAFQEAGWPTRIEHNIDVSSNWQPVHDAVKTLNRGLKQIAFHVDGAHIFWTSSD